MSTFEVKIVKIDGIEPIENADLIEVAQIAGYRSVAKKGQFSVNDLAVYIPEASIVPEWLLIHMGLEGKLAGRDKNRVKCCKLRGVISQGILLPVEYDPEQDGVIIRNETGFSTLVNLDQDVAEFLGIVKWEPPVPIHLAGEVFNLGAEYTLRYDIENIKWFPDVLENQEVVASEKLHGSNLCIGINILQQNIHKDLLEGDTFVASKGLGGKGLVFKWNEQNANNTYIKAYHGLANDKGTLRERVLGHFDYESKINNLLTILEAVEDTTMGDLAIQAICDELVYLKSSTSPKWIYIIGECFGKGIQDLSYGLEKPEFRAFDVYVGKSGEGRYLSYYEKKTLLEALDIKMVPLVYEGIYDKTKIEELTLGKNIEGKAGTHIREGLVITPKTEMHHDKLGRVILKSINPNYLLRGGDATEFN